MRRRPIPGDQGATAAQDPGSSQPSKPRALRWAPSPLVAFLALLVARLVSAGWNIVHDCDEVYNYWEPLHYLLYGYGKQTWEYSPRFALRSYLYLLVHMLVAFPAKLLFGSSAGKVYVFYATRAALGTFSASLEAILYRCVLQKDPGVATAFLCSLMFSSGMFFSSTTFLPSTFAMYAMMAATVGMLQGHIKVTIASAVVGVLLGWPVAGIAFLPYALVVLFRPHLLTSIAMAAMAGALTLAPFVLADRYFYGKWTVSLWNFISYNVIGGGQSALYGVEGATFYLKNGLNTFNLALPLALLLPVVAVLHWWHLGSQTANGKDKGKESSHWLTSLLVACCPFYVWSTAISMLPHKEERFLYVVYPQICLAAAVSLELLLSLTKHIAPTAMRTKSRAQWMDSLFSIGKLTVLVLHSMVSISRVVAIVSHYGAPLAVYSSLPSPSGGLTLEKNASIQVCVGMEWHRFPSAFFLPSSQHRLAFVEAGFTGLLPAAFDPSAGGTSSSSDVLNDKNEHQPSLYLQDLASCDYLVDFELPLWEPLRSSRPDVQWDVIASRSFVEASLSPPLTRALWIPWLSQQQNVVGQYVLLQQRRAHL